jgi:hypothetical protein
VPIGRAEARPYGQFGRRLLVDLRTDDLHARDRGLGVEGPSELVRAVYALVLRGPAYIAQGSGDGDDPAGIRRAARERLAANLGAVSVENVDVDVPPVASALVWNS